MSLGFHDYKAGDVVVRSSQFHKDRTFYRIESREFDRVVLQWIATKGHIPSGCTFITISRAELEDHYVKATASEFEGAVGG